MDEETVLAAAEWLDLSMLLYDELMHKRIGHNGRTREGRLHEVVSDLKRPITHATSRV